jgi:hypothetical protein
LRIAATQRNKVIQIKNAYCLAVHLFHWAIGTWLPKCRQRGRKGDRLMLISVKAVRDRDHVVLGEAVFEVNDKQMGRNAIADLIEHLYASGRDLLKLSLFTFVFEKVDAPPRPRCAVGRGGSRAVSPKRRALGYPSSPTRKRQGSRCSNGWQSGQFH